VIREHDRVVLLADLPEKELAVGDVGTVVHVYAEGNAYEVEFMTLVGESVAVVTLPVESVREVLQDEVTHARQRRAA